MITACRTIVLALCILAGPPPVAAVLPERSVSTSRQFLVYGPDIRLRGVICDLAERAKQDLLRLIGQRDAWSTPIVIHAQYPQANLPEIPRALLHLSQTGFGLKLQLNLTIASNGGPLEIRRDLLSAVLLEMMYRQVPDVPAGTTYVPPPEWLLDGLEAHSSMTGSSAGFVAADKICSLKEFLRQRPASLDVLGRSLYRLYSAALLEVLVQLPERRQRLARFISNLSSASGDGMVHLQIYFPELIDATGALERMWVSQIARLSTDHSYQLLSGKESERRLNNLLSLRLSAARSEKCYQLHEFPIFLRDVSAKPVLVRLGRDLSALRTCASPIYRPTIFEYEKIATLLWRGKTNGVAKRLARLSATRAQLAAQMRKIDDYMNWFETTKSQGSSGLFADYLKTGDLADRPKERRRDPFSVYLDVLEAEFQN